MKACSSLSSEGGDLSSVSWFFLLQNGLIVVFWGSGGVCACRSGLGVLRRPGRRLQRDGEHRRLGRAVSAVELGPAVQRAPRGHRGRLAPQRPRGSRLLQVRPRPHPADVAARGNLILITRRDFDLSDNKNMTGTCGVIPFLLLKFLSWL